VVWASTKKVVDSTNKYTEGFLSSEKRERCRPRTLKEIVKRDLILNISEDLVHNQANAVVM